MWFAHQIGFLNIKTQQIYATKPKYKCLDKYFFTATTI
jgi:hypothetical protein